MCVVFQAGEEIAHRLSSHDDLLRENIELRAQTRGAEQERDRVTEERDQVSV